MTGSCSRGESVTQTARPMQLDPKLVDEFKEWRKEYDEWLKALENVLVTSVAQGRV